VSLIRDLLGVTSIQHTLREHHRRMESRMTKMLDAFQALAAQVNAASAAQQTAFTNFQNAFDRMAQAVRDGELSPEAQSAFDDLTAALETIRQNAIVADDAVEPQPETPAEPTPVPVEGETPVDVTDPTIPQPTER
jgi:hypothetical protein